MNRGVPTVFIAPDSSNENGGQEKNENTGTMPRRVRKILIKQPPIPLTATSEAVNKWFDEAHDYLSNEEIQSDSWTACIAAWVTFEKANGSVNTTSVSVVQVSAHPLNTDAQIEESLAGFDRTSC